MTNIQKKSLLASANWLLAGSIICILSGVLFWLYPSALAKGAIIAVGGLFVLFGLITFLIAYSDIRDSRFTSMSFFVSVLLVITGCVLMIWSTFFAQWFMMVTGIVIILLSIRQIIDIVQLRRYDETASLWLLINPIILLIMGVIVVMNPQSVNNLVGYIAAIGLIYYGLSGTFVSFRIRRSIKRLN